MTASGALLWPLLPVICFSCTPALKMEAARSSKRPLTLAGLHSVTSHKTVLVITSVIRISGRMFNKFSPWIIVFCVIIFYGAVCQALLPFHTNHRCPFQSRFENLALSYGQGGEQILQVHWRWAFIKKEKNSQPYGTGLLQSACKWTI